MPEIVTKDILQVFVACDLWGSVDEGLVNENKAPKFLQNSRRNIAVMYSLPSPPGYSSRSRAGEDFMWLLSTGNEEQERKTWRITLHKITL